jgi:hypothetical protein
MYAEDALRQTRLLALFAISASPISPSPAMLCELDLLL